MENGLGQRDTRRRGSFSRLLTRLRSALRRRGRGNRDAVASSRTAVVENSREATAIDNLVEDASLTGTIPPVHEVANTSTLPALKDDMVLVPDDDDSAMTSNDIPLRSPPMRAPRSCLSQEKAQALFDKYGVKYEPFDVPIASRERSMRVERPIRVIIHWTCHDCNTQFGPSKTCVGCGHRRCTDCPRIPPKLAKEALDNTQIGSNGRPDAAAGERLDVGGLTCAMVVEASEESMPTPVIGPALPTMLEARSPEDLATNDVSTKLQLPKEATPPPDPALLQSVNDKLAHLTVRSTTTEPSTTAT
ncbi:hypothetical protein LTR09_006882 [Extremus antarcticus]|uniref:Uncharacterized protein n=1 Tax=Extremus antarcticus TaxID=702011 RepID=A0AAJ0G871_9PEZI|nr:hypothetical protein LTR09_006882 [Extremus antarcticus]